MLRAMAGTGAPVPAVLAVNEQALVIEFLPDAGTLGSTLSWTSLGKAMAQLHSATNERYGWAEEKYAFGPLEFSNAWSENWPHFWAERRLRPHIGHLPAAIGQRLERLIADLTNRLPAKPRPVLLHGDLWAGNILVGGNEEISGLIDPACYFGHYEVDFAMLRVFGHPPAALYEAYGPLEAGFEQRQPIYQLWTALVHLRLFGSSYQSIVEALLTKAGV